MAFIDGRVLPDFLIVGAGRGGTTTLWNVLRRHPQVFMPPLKDLKYFCPDAPKNTYADGLDAYAALFASEKGAIARGEASVAYLNDSRAAALIRETLPDVKLIFIFRDPADRTYSNYWKELQTGVPLPPFSALAKSWADPFPRFVEYGCYGSHLTRYLEQFPREQILCLRHEALMAEPERLFSQLCAFVGIDPALLPRDFDTRNAAAKPLSAILERNVLRSRTLIGAVKALVPLRMRMPLRRALVFAKKLNRKTISYPPMDVETRRILTAHFHPEVEKLEHLTGWDLRAWKAG